MRLKGSKILVPVVAVILTAAALLPSTGCNTTGCTDNRSALLLAGFYSAQTHKPIAVDSIEVGGVGAPNDSLLIKDYQKESDVYFPLRSQLTETSFFIHYAAKELNDPAIDDVVTVQYTAVPYFVSEECGAMYYYQVHNLTYTTHIIDSIALPDSLINNVNVERMKIFFRTASTKSKTL